MANVKAYITQVPMGNLTIEGLMTEKGDYFVSVPQVADQFTFDKNQASREVKALLGKGFTFDKLAVNGTKTTVNALSLPDFERVLRALDRKGNKTAQEMTDSLIGLSLHQLFCDAFGVKFEGEERAQWLRMRQEGKSARRTLTDAIKSYIERHPEMSESKAKFMYSNTSDRVNKAVFGRVARVLYSDFRVSPDSLRDAFSDTELRHIAMVEEEAMYLIDREDCDPCQAVLVAREKFSFPVCDRKLA